jgi:hypothetical protein
LDYLFGPSDAAADPVLPRIAEAFAPVAEPRVRSRGNSHKPESGTMCLPCAGPQRYRRETALFLSPPRIQNHRPINLKALPLTLRLKQ